MEFSLRRYSESNFTYINDLDKFSNHYQCNKDLITRNDASHATRHMVPCAKDALMASKNLLEDQAEILAKDILEKSYKNWHERMSSAYAAFYRPYDNSKGSIYIYDAEVTNKHLHQLAETFCVDEYAGVKPIIVSLDDLITGPDMHEISFSRLFDMGGIKSQRYVARPSHPSLVEQFNNFAKAVENFDKKTPVILLEDNVRKTHMIEWVLDKIDFFELYNKVEVVGVASCFSINYRLHWGVEREGHYVPIKSLIKYVEPCADVITTRDFLFDGFVVDSPEGPRRLPHVFNNMSRLFDTRENREPHIREILHEINLEFFNAVEKEIGGKILSPNGMLPKQVYDRVGLPQNANFTDLLEANHKHMKLALNYP
jgi:hypothetical protein